MAWDSMKLFWKGTSLYRYGSSKVLAEIVPDDKYPGMWRIKLPGAPLSDMVNRTRAKDAAMYLALKELNAGAKVAGQGAR